MPEMSQKKFNQMWDDHLICIHDHREADKKEDMHLIHNIYFPNCTWSGEKREVRVHVDCNETWCMLSDPSPCALFTQEIDPEDLVPRRPNSYTPTAQNIKEVYDHFTRSLNLLNQNVPQGDRIHVPFILQGVLWSYIEEREAIESIQEAGARTGGDSPSRDAHA